MQNLSSNPVATSFMHHFALLGLCAILSIMCGFFMFVMRRYKVVSAAGLMTAAWGLVNFIIVFVAQRNVPQVFDQGTRDFLVFNLGLNLGYIGTGIAMALAGKSKELLRGFGWAIAVQGALLLLLDLRLFLLLRG